MNNIVNILNKIVTQLGNQFSRMNTQSGGYDPPIDINVNTDDPEADAIRVSNYTPPPQLDIPVINDFDEINEN